MSSESPQSAPDLAFQARMAELARLVGNAQLLADQAGLSRRVVGKYLAGDSEPSRERLVRLAQAANVTVEWLATGRGPKHPAQPPPPDEQLMEDAIEVAEWALARRERAMTPRAKASFVAAIYNILSAEPEARSEEQREERRERVLRVVVSAP